MVIMPSAYSDQFKQQCVDAVLVLGKSREVPRVLFLGICLDFHYFSTGVVFPKFGFDFSRGAVAQALVEP